LPILIFSFLLSPSPPGEGTRCRNIEICDLLSLEEPRLEIDRRDSSTGVATYDVAAVFPHDPFLARAGRIGEVNGVLGDKAAVKRCSAKVANYLIGLVEEEEEIAREVAEERERVTSWSTRALSAEIRRGLSQII
jgi:hypothetical protein